MDGNIRDYEFTNDWFAQTALSYWKSIIPKAKPKKVLEIGSFEGASSCYMIGANQWHDDLSLYCVDTWEGGVEHQARGIDMASVEKKFDQNVALAQSLSAKASKVTKLKGTSDVELAKLLAEGHGGTFDFVYVDGSHQAPDVILDAILAFKLCKVGGIIGFDDYLWAEELPTGRDLIRCPKMAIDAFTNLFFRKVRALPLPLSQLYLVKVAD